MADYYGDAAGFKAYWTARGDAVLPQMDDDAIKQALLVASEWIDASFSFPGYKTGQREQVREWPRSGAYDNYGYSIGPDEFPRELIQATYVAAGKQARSPGIFYKDYTPGKYKSASISGAVSVEYNTSLSAWALRTQFPEIGAIISPILGDNGRFSPMSGDIARV